MKRYAQPPTLETLPSEILNQIFSYLDQRTLHSLIFCSKKLLEEASYNLYECPRFATTYRFAQFVTTITHDRHRAWMVKEFDVSNLGKSSGPEDEKSLAGWREWKFRSDPLHTIHRDDYGSGGVAKRTGGKKSTHPPPSPFLQRYSYIRDIPIGAVLHALAACPLIKRIDLSNVPLAADYFVSSLGSYRTAYYPTAFTGLLFVSDVPKSFTWKEGDTQPVLSNNDLVDAVTKLQSLQSIGLRGDYGLREMWRRDW
ncbi:hypothetical protein BDZ91DRAFT_23581 [Kalaharituber pfeilii]|nr:hypothetical protein BDZ91DRAFT_23581 [Kalaharituber pfeilii]